VRLLLEPLVGRLRDQLRLDGLEEEPEGVRVELVVVDVAASARNYCCAKRSLKLGRALFSIDFNY
jgi:hypothetical protein